MPKKVSLDEVLGKRKENLGKTVSGEEALFKGATSAPSSWDKDERSAVFVMTTEEQDRDKDIVVQAGIDLSHFVKNPQALLFHNSRTWPVGGWNDIKMVNGRPKRHEGRLKFLPADGPVKEVDQAAWMVEHGGIKAVSIGFMPKDGAIEYVDEEKGYWGGLKFLETELYECSLVPIPAHPSALVKNAAGNMTLAKEFIEEILDTYAKDPRTGALIERKLYEDEFFSIVQPKSVFKGFKMVPLAEEPAEPETKPETKDAGTDGAGNEGADTTQTLDGNGDQGETVTQPSSKETTVTVTVEATKSPTESRRKLTDFLKGMLGFKSEPEQKPEEQDKSAIVPGSLSKAKDALSRYQTLLQD